MSNDDFPFRKDPPLDWRLTPKNILIQVLALAVFLGAIAILGWIMWDAVKAVWH